MPVRWVLLAIAVMLSFAASGQTVTPPVLRSISPGTASIWVEYERLPYAQTVAVTCGGRTAIGNDGLIAIGGLVPGVPVTCSATQTTAWGETSAPSAPSVDITPLAPPVASQSPILMYVQSHINDQPFNFDSLLAAPDSGWQAYYLQSAGRETFLIASPALGQEWLVSLGGADGAPLSVGKYTGATGYVAPGKPYVSMRKNGGYSSGGGAFEILDLVRGANGEIVSLAVDFELLVWSYPTVFGQLRYHSAVPLNPTNFQPYRLRVAPRVGAWPGSVVESYPISISKINVPVPISITNGEYSINGGPFTSVAGTVQNGQSVVVRTTAGPTNNWLSVSTLQVSGMRLEFRVGTNVDNRPQPDGASVIVTIPQLPTDSQSQVDPSQVMSAAGIYRFSLGNGSSVPTLMIQRHDGFDYYPQEGGSYITGPDGAPLAVGSYAGARAAAVSGKPRFDFGNNCAGGDRPVDFVVREVAYAADGMLTRLAVDYTMQYVDTGNYQCPRVFGYIRVNSVVPIDYTINEPFPLNFSPAVNRPLSTMTTSETQVVRGINVPVAISIADGEYSIDGGPFTSQPGMIARGQTVAVRRLSAATGDTSVTAILTIAGKSSAFRIGTQSFELRPQPSPSGAALSVLLPVTFPGDLSQMIVHTPATVSTIGMQAAITPGSIRFVASRPHPMYNWQAEGVTVQARSADGAPMVPGVYPDAKSFASAGSPFLWVQINPLGSVCSIPQSQMFTVHEIEHGTDGIPTRLALDYVLDCGPNAFPGLVKGFIRLNTAFPINYANSLPFDFNLWPVSGQAPGTWANWWTPIRGVDGFVPVSIVGGEYSINDGPYTSAPGFISDGQQLRVRLRASNQYSTVVTGSIAVGERVRSFSVGTSAAPDAQPDGAAWMMERHQLRDGAFVRKDYQPASFYNVDFAHPNSGEAVAVAAQSNAYGHSSLRVGFAAANAAELVPGVYLNATPNGRDGDLAVPTLTGSGCGYAKGAKFVVHEFERAAIGTPVKIAIDYVVPCGTSSYVSNIFGHLRINSTVPIDYTIRRPSQYFFNNVLAVAPGAWVESNEVTVQGFELPLPILVNGGEYSIDAGPYVTTPGTILPGQKVRLRTMASSQENDLVVATLNIGEGTADFKVGTRAGDNPQPHAGATIVLASQQGGLQGGGRTIVISPATLGVTTAEYAADYNRVVVTATEAWNEQGPGGTLWDLHFGMPGSQPWSPGRQVNPGQWWSADRPSMSIQQRGLAWCEVSAASEFTLHEVVFDGTRVSKLALDFINYCGNNAVPLRGHIRINSTIPISHATDDQPTAFTFYERYYASPGMWVESENVVTLSGFNVPLPISITGGEYSLDGGAYTSMPGTVMVGQRVRIRAMSPNVPGTTSQSTLTVGSVMGTFRVYTPFDISDQYPDSFSLGSVYDAPLNQWVYSPVIALTGTNVSVYYEVNNGQLSAGGRPFSSTGQIAPGETLQVRLMSPAAYTQYNYARVYVGSYSTTFYVYSRNMWDVNVAINGNGSVSLQTPPDQTCALPCRGRFFDGTSVTLVANAPVGQTFLGWSGACVGTAPCVLNLTRPANITASFGVTAPGAPVLSGIVAGDGRAIISFTPPGGTGLPPTSYRASCLPGNIQSPGQSSPIIVTGLTNGTTYDCTVSAVNNVGQGSASNSLSVTPSNAAALTLVAVYSRKSHGALGDFDLPVETGIPVTGAVTVEPRIIGAGHTIVFRFNAPITEIGAVLSFDPQSQPLGTVSVAISGSDVLVTIAGVPNASRATVSLIGVNATLNAGTAIGFLVGDLDGSGSVTALDVKAVKTRSGWPATINNFSFDVNTSGNIGAADLAAVKARVGTQLP